MHLIDKVLKLSLEDFQINDKISRILGNLDGIKE
jgi:hypothetical protein